MLTRKLRNKKTITRKLSRLRFETLEPRATPSAMSLMAATISVSPVAALHVTEGQRLQDVVATFTDSNAAAKAHDFIARIDWGDGTASIGRVIQGTTGFNVVGTHTYRDGGTDQIVVTVRDHSGNQGSDAAFVRTNLVSDGFVPALTTDTNLVNPWGLVAGPTTPFWVADNGAGVSTLYNGDGVPQPAGSPLVVTIPPPNGGTPPSAPTGLVFNNSTTDFMMDGQPARFIFATEDGTIAAWRRGLTPADQAVLEVDNSPASAIYKGLAVGTTHGQEFLYATDFHNGKIDVFDTSFHAATLPGGFQDPNLPAGYAPFGIANVNGKLYVSYALQDTDKVDDVAGAGNGFIDVFTASGNLVRRLVSGGTTDSSLNSPWGMVVAPKNFGPFSGALLVGNFGDGKINAFNPRTGAFLGQLTDASGKPIQNDGLWSLSFGNGAAANGSTRDLFFTAGLNDEADGLFGKLVLTGTQVTVAEGQLTGFGVPINARVGVPATRDVAVFFDENPFERTAEFTVLIDWGDGTTPSAGRVLREHGIFHVVGQHSYATTGTFNVTVTITDPGVDPLKLKTTATVTEKVPMMGRGGDKD